MNKKILILAILFLMPAFPAFAVCPAEAPVSVNLHTVPDKFVLTCASEWPIKIIPGQKKTVVICIHNPDLQNEIITTKAFSSKLPIGFIYVNSILDVTLNPNETKCGAIKSPIIYQPILEVNVDSSVQLGSYNFSLENETDFWDYSAGRWSKWLFRLTIPVKVVDVIPVCGNSSCEADETCVSCAADCGACPVPKAESALVAKPKPKPVLPKVVSLSASFSSFTEIPNLKAEEKEALKKAEAMRDSIVILCKKDPHSCSCQQIPCDDILQTDNPRAKEVYQKCVAERDKCEGQRQGAIKEMSEQKDKISAQCRKDLKKCDCDQVKDDEGKKQCELAIIEAKYQAEQQKNEKINFCRADMDKCECGSIENEEGKAECKAKLLEAKQAKEKIESSCKENLASCDCSVIGNEDAKKECETKKAEAFDEADNKVKEFLSKCFRDVENCKCDQLGLEKQEWVSFCDIQKNYGLSCKHEGLDCDKLENVEIYPSGMPAWIGKIFAKSYKSYVAAEKEKGVKEAAGLITTCLKDTENCDCSKAPTYARAHCEKTKALQIKCYAGDYDACLVLEKTPNLPEGVPSFSYSFLDKLVAGLRNLQEGLVKANAARKIGNMILACMDDASKCDCSMAPSGSIKTFCEHKKELVGSCWDKHYESCFALDEEPIMPADTPNFIMNYAEKNVLPQVETKKQAMFDKLKLGTVCEKAATIKECKKIFFK